MEFDDDGIFGIVYVPKDSLPVLVESSRREDSGDAGAGHLEAVPPPGREFRIMAHAANVAKRNVELAFESPKLVETADFKVKIFVCQGYFDHVAA